MAKSAACPRYAWRVLAALAVATMFASAAGAQWIELEFCNRRNAAIYVARASEGPSGQWASEGWFKIEPGRCRQLVHADIVYTSYGGQRTATYIPGPWYFAFGAYDTRGGFGVLDFDWDYSDIGGRTDLRACAYEKGWKLTNSSRNGLTNCDLRRDPNARVIPYNLRVGGRKVAAQGHAEGQLGLGRAYNNGWGVPKDPVRAVALFRRAADQGLAAADYEMARAHERGSGVQQNDTEAMRLYERAASKGHVRASEALRRLRGSG